MLKSKLFIIIFMIFIILFCYTSFCSASFDFTYNDTDYSLGDFTCYDNYFILYVPSINSYLLLSYESLNNMSFFIKDGDFYISSNNCKVNCICNTYEVSSGSWSSDFFVSNSTVYTAYNYEDLVYSSFDIIDTEGNLLFQAPVLTTETPTLGEVLEKANPVETFQTMTHGMITYLLVFLVGLVAFWKAWSLLSKSLRKA